MKDYTDYTTMTDQSLINRVFELVACDGNENEELAIVLNILMRRNTPVCSFDSLLSNSLHAKGPRFAVKFIDEVRSGAYKSKSLSSSAKRTLKKWMTTLSLTELEAIDTSVLAYLLRIIHPKPLPHQESCFKEALNSNPVENFV